MLPRPRTAAERVGRPALACCVLALAAVDAPAQTRPRGPQEDAGLAALVRRLGEGRQPTGAGVRVGQVEVAAPDRYAPDARHPEFAGKRFLPVSGPSSANLHATRVGAWLYGRESGLAPGIERVEAFEVMHWLGAGFLNGSGSEPPEVLQLELLNNSWVGDAGLESNQYLRKLDRAIEEQGLVVVGGTANGAGELAFPLLTHSYNALSVGRADGLHGAGETLMHFDGPGRMKPEIVGSAPETSFATPLVSGAAALLLETARRHPRLAGAAAARRPHVLKSVLLAGATHGPGWWNGSIGHGPLRGATDRPLDPVLGAGVVDVDRSHWILTAGPNAAGAGPLAAPAARAAGWAELEVGSGQSRWLRLEVAAWRPHLSVTAVWNRRVREDLERFGIPDFDLELYVVDERGQPDSLVGAAGRERFRAGNALSDSRVDNVEHLFVQGLTPGEYLLQVRRSWDFLPDWSVALAWELACQAPRSYGAGKPTSRGTLPVLGPVGVPAAFAGEFALELTGGVPHAVGRLVLSPEPARLDLAGGELVVRPPFEAATTVVLDAEGRASIPLPISPDMAGTTRYAQVVFRDPHHPDGTGTGLSNGLRIQFCE